ncbi:transposase [Geomicrobium halophilum]|uniref:transposase n=1 Tax=Geomicrobium halophilum TaxID=549000 RepID=UPI003CCD050A
MLADKIYLTRENLKYCKERGISLTGPKLGRPLQARIQRAKAYREAGCRRTKCH